MEKEVFPRVRPVLEQLALARLDFADDASRLRVDQLSLSPAAWARRFGVEATPGFVLLDPQGRPILRESGLLAHEAFGLFLAYGSTGAYRHAPFAEYVRSTQGAAAP